MTMRHIEMHLIENAKDVISAEIAGLEVYPDEKCENCFTLVGDGGKSFVPFLIVLDDEDEWVVCKECATPVL